MHNRNISIKPIATVGLALLLALIQQSVVFAEELELEYFAKHPDYRYAEISPDGKHVAVTLIQDDQIIMAVINRKSMKATAGARPQLGASVNDFYWVNDERVAYTISEDPPEYDFPTANGELYAVNADGGRHKAIFGYRAAESEGRGTFIRRKENTYAGHDLVDLLPDDEDHILISEYPWRLKGNYWVGDQYAKPELMRLNVYTGLKKRVDTLPIPGSYARTDDSHQPRICIGADENANLQVSWKPAADGDWEALAVDSLLGTAFPLELSTDSDTMLVWGTEKAERPRGLYQVDLKSANSKEVFVHAYADVDQIIRDIDNENIVAAKMLAGVPEYHYLQGLENRTVKLHQSLRQAFAGQDVEITSHTRDGAEAIVLVSSDRNPGAFYIFNTETMKAKYLFARQSWVDPEQMRPMQPIQLQARDDTSLHGFLTRPDGDGPYPLVVMPHGGPHGVQDNWGYDAEIQLLANRGYAVLNINYRGSGGYGKNFQESGYGEWGASMQDDLTDATLWAIEQGITETGRICIVGGSYGGYAALMGAVREPDLYRCSIGFAGVYDLPMMFEKGDIPDQRTGLGYLRRVLGEDQEKLQQRSPASRAAEIKASVMLIHGAEDERVPIAQAERMREALRALDKDPEWLVFSKEGHGIFDEKNRVEYYRQMLKFLRQHIGT
jgi:dipeptidyl aminopeptidase/acylaminoacyl peptidase